ncbi:MAG: nucleotide exchange factor GrpE [Oscillospiraceae bacterium]|nr:nucleotide exchange factor GrpE [Oscillospiraceae bacterium]
MSTDNEKKDTAAQEAPEEPKVEPEAPEVKEEPAPETKAEKKDKKAAKKKEAERIAALESEVAALNDKFLRVCAEYDNFRRRSQKEKEALYGDIKADTVQKFLPVYDNLERALKQGTEDEAYRKGVEMIMTQFTTTLEKLGVTPIECLGEKFDPAFHNAVMHVDDEEKGENEIVEVFQKGFKLGDKVIRFAMVKVAN